MSDCEYCQNKNNDDLDATAAKKPIGDGLVITTVVATAAATFFNLRMTGVGQHNALLTSTSLAWFMSLPIWK